MAHPCFSCGSECYCHGDWDDVIVSHTPSGCIGCGCEEFWEADDDQPWPDDEEDDWQYTEPDCSACGGQDGKHMAGCPDDDSPYALLLRRGFD